MLPDEYYADVRTGDLFISKLFKEFVLITGVSCARGYATEITYIMVEMKHNGVTKINTNYYNPRDAGFHKYDWRRLCCDGKHEP